MSTKNKIKLFIFAILDIALLAICLVEIFHPFLHFGNYGLFNAKGSTAQAQGRLIVTAFLIMLVIVLPVLAAGFFIAFKYRAGRQQTYDPGWGDRHQSSEFLMWVFPILIIIFLSILNFKSARELDPSKAIVSAAAPITIQVVALQWKWLFIYPRQNIATVNFIDIPQNVPVHFELTADAPMSLFWIPQLGGQMAAMAGMVNQMNLMANQTGQFIGQNSEINGDGYARMKFTVNSVSQNNFNAWVTSVEKSSAPLTQNTYNSLSQPSEDARQSSYSYVSNNLYNSIIMKYMMPMPSEGESTSTMQNMQNMQGMDMPNMPGMDMK